MYCSGVPLPKYSAYVIFIFLCSMLANFDWKNWNWMQWSTFSRASMHSLPLFLHTFLFIIIFVASPATPSLLKYHPTSIPMYGSPKDLVTLQTSLQTETQRRNPGSKLVNCVKLSFIIKVHSLQSERVEVMEQKL